jgi:hypothetical protein
MTREPVIHRKTPEERGAELAAFDRLLRREAWRERIGHVLASFGAVAVGFAGMGLGAHMADATWGPVVFWSGFLAGSALWLAALVWGFRRARERGDL